MEFPTSAPSLAYEAALSWARENAATAHGAHPRNFGEYVAQVYQGVLHGCLADPEAGRGWTAAEAEADAPNKKEATAHKGKADSPQSSPAAASESPASKDATGTAKEPPSADTGADPEVTYEQVAAAFLRVAKADRAKAMGALEKRKIASPRALKPEEYADFIKEMES
jgi:hypothetical protein